MNKHRKSQGAMVMAACGVLLLAGSVLAQPRQGGGGPPPLPDADGIEQMVEEMAAALSLTDAQKAEVSDLHVAHFKKARSLMEKNTGERGSGREAMESLRKEFDEQIKELLNDEQQEAFEELKNDREQAKGRQRPQRGRR